MDSIVYKICNRKQWRDAERTGVFKGAAIDIADGYIHLSDASQVRETASKHFAGQTGLVIVAVDASKLGNALRYEVSRGGAPFPHLYGDLPVDSVRWVKPLALGPGGDFVFPELA